MTAFEACKHLQCFIHQTLAGLVQPELGLFPPAGILTSRDRPGLSSGEACQPIPASYHGDVLQDDHRSYLVSHGILFHCIIDDHLLQLNAY